MKGRFKKGLYGLLTVLFLITGVVFIYVNDDYDATDEALLALETNETVRVSGEKPVSFYPNISEKTDTGIIFYPGGKVEEEAYAPLLQRLAEEGYAVFLVDMPLGLAVLDINAAEEIMEDHPEIADWYLAGHSLGGSMAAIFASNTTKELAGLILLASYSTADLSEMSLPILSIYGSEDRVIDVEKVDEYRSMLPEDRIEKVIEGGNHAQFGHYGKQEGDGESTISALDQQEITATAISQFIESNK